VRACLAVRGALATRRERVPTGGVDRGTLVIRLPTSVAHRPHHVHLSKLHATGNDFLVAVDLGATAACGSSEAEAALARALCDRHRGVGADGFIRILPGSDGADLSMVLRNADGSEAEISGNGVRCLAWVAVTHGQAPDTFTLATGGGLRTITVERGDGGAVAWATVDMGGATLEPAGVPVLAESTHGLVVQVDGTRYEGDAVGMGNPHLVLHLPSEDALDAVPLERHGPVLEHDPRFPRRTNVHFSTVTGRDRLRLRIWERGAGATLSCGSGACAAAVSAHQRGLVGERVAVAVPGGELAVELGSTVRLGGPVQPLFDVDVDASRLGSGA
jgi:diaminopimelate epimerase